MNENQKKALCNYRTVKFAAAIRDSKNINSLIRNSSSCQGVVKWLNYMYERNYSDYCEISLYLKKRIENPKSLYRNIDLLSIETIEILKYNQENEQSERMFLEDVENEIKNNDDEKLKLMIRRHR